MSITEGKKRGRKSKAEKELLLQQKQNEPEQPVVPKKRGRKPKGGKIIQNLSELPKPIDLSPSIILHLKCSLSDIDNNTETLLDGNNLINNNKTTDLNFQIINNEINSKNDNYINNDNLNNKYLINSNSTENKNLKDISSKLKVLEKSLHHNNITNKNSACFWCTCCFDNPPIYIPKHEINSEYHVYGNFCSPECASAYLMKEDIDTSSKFERYQFLNYLYSKVYNYTKNIKPAPNPHYILDKFYGNLTIQEFRKLSQNNNLLLVIDKPLTRIMPEIHEDNDDFLLNHTIQNNNFRLKRNKVTQSKSDILSENFGM